ncbi:MAG: T9SS type A sorting domain-containing protein [Vicingaceae bacterium]|nr:T9SS type A sorting domain-containing protein [Vicingaceae bacterium]
MRKLLLLLWVGLLSTFTTNVFAAAPPYQTCAAAGNLAVIGSPYSGTTVSASNNVSTCSMGSAPDQIFYYDLPNGSTLTIGQTTNNYDSRHSLRYNGVCPGTIEIVCTDDPDTQVESWQNCTGSLQRVWWIQSGWSSSSGTYTLSWNVVAGTCPVPPSNDNPCAATPATVNADLLCGSVTAGTVSNATNSGIVACTGNANNDVWFSFVATSTVHNFDLLNIAGLTTDMVFEIFSGACGSLSSIACSDPESNQFSGFTIGQTYYVRVYTYGSTSATTTFNLCIGTPPPPPTNDEPCGAIVLNVNIGSCAFQSAVLGTSSTVSTGMPAPGCSSLGPDVWFKVTVPAGGLIIDLAPNGGPTDMGMAWYTGPNCNNLTTLVECDDDDSQNGAMPMICRTGASCTIPGDCAQNAKLPTGTVVYIRIWEYGGDLFGPFDICAYEPAPAGAPSNCASATNITSLPYSNSAQTTCCRVNSYTSTNGCLSTYQNGEDFMYTYTPVVNQTIDVTLTGTLSYTGVFITDNCPSVGSANCIASATSTSGNPTLCGVSLTAGTTYYIMIDTYPNPTCTPFNINITSSSTPTCGLNYAISSIGFAPDLNAGTNIALPIDDRFGSSYTPIGFTFCFDGFGFSQLLVSSNGYVIFDPISCASNLPSTNAAPGGTSGWSISAAIPNTTDAPRNAILFPWQDINPALGGTIRYQTLGVTPNRRFVLTFDNVPYFDCPSLLFTGQLKLFETTNNIEMHITNKTTCSGWNGEDAILGLHNFNGTIARVPAGYNYPTNWNATNKAWRFTNNCVGCIVLPVELVQFFGVSTNKGNELQWQTLSEINNDYFIIEASTDARNFEAIANIKGAGNSNELLSYHYLDKNPMEDLMYYRLKQVDFDGQFEYSDVISVRRVEEGEVIISPNPVNDVLNIELKIASSGNYKFIITDLLGAVIEKNIQLSKGSNKVKLDIFTTLPQGFYMLKIVDENNTIITTKKIVKN